MNKILGVDIDGVLADYNYGLAAIVAKAQGKQLEDMPKPSSWGFHNWDLDEVSFKTYHTELCKSRGLKALRPIEGGREALLRAIEKGYRIRIITQRASTSILTQNVKADILIDTIEWLNLNEIPFHEICFVEDKHLVAADLYIEDAPHHLQAYHEVGFSAIKFNHEYNKNSPSEYSISSWSELDLILEKEKNFINV